MLQRQRHLEPLARGHGRDLHAPGPFTIAKPPGVYRPRHPERSPLHRVLEDHFDEYLWAYEGRFEHRYARLRPVMPRTVEAFLACGRLHEEDVKRHFPLGQHGLASGVDPSPYQGPGCGTTLRVGVPGESSTVGSAGGTLGDRSSRPA